jgi:hypothetical protein
MVCPKLGIKATFLAEKGSIRKEFHNFVLKKKPE